MNQSDATYFGQKDEVKMWQKSKRAERKKPHFTNDSKNVDSVTYALSKNKFTDRIFYCENFNLAVFKIFSDYFNIIYQDKEKQKEHEIEMIGLFAERFTDTIELYGNFGSKEVLFNFLGLNIKMSFTIFKNNGEIFYQINMSSAEPTLYKSTFVYDELFKRALTESELVGSYITMPAGYFKWDIELLEQRSMKDIYLPKKQTEDLQMFINVFSNNKSLLRYLLVGVPGTGKTEACLSLMNELKKQNVTIIKTPVCKYLREKVKLAVLLKPCIIIFDDLDLSLGSRNSGGYSEMLQSFLDILDGTDKLPKNVGILATTNSAFLLDIAAQRPGRFDKVMIFDELSKDNIRKIILKSLKFNFNLSEESDVKIFIEQKIVDKFHSSSVTGAHIYNSISMMKLKHDMLEKSKNTPIEITPEWLLEEIECEIKILEKIKNQQKISDRLNNSGAMRKIGFTEDQPYDDGLTECEEESFLIGSED